MTTYYVRKSGPNTGGTTPATAFSSIANALSVVATGDLVIVGSGVFSESLNPTPVGTTWIGDYFGHWTGDRGETTVTSITLATNTVVSHINCNGSVAGSTGSTILGSKVLGNLTLSNTHDMSIGNIYLSGTITITNATNITMDSCTLISTSVPITVTTDLHSIGSLYVRNSIIHGTSDSSYLMNMNIDPVSNLSMDNNIFWRTSGKQDLFFRNQQTGVEISGLPNWQLTGNDQNSWFVNPVVGPGYVISQLSPAYGTGTSSLGMDISGTQRILGSTDIGCYQVPRDKSLPIHMEETRFRYEYPLESAKVVDSLARFQQFLGHYFGVENAEGGLVRKGLVPTMLTNISNIDKYREERLEIPRRIIDNIIGNLSSLRNRKW